MLSYNRSIDSSALRQPVGVQEVLSARVRLGRNLSGIRFSHKMDDHDRLELRRRVETAFSALHADFIVLDAETMEPAERAFYQYRGLLGAATRLTVLQNDGLGFVRIPDDDHLGLYATCAGLDLSRAHQTAAALDAELEHQLSYAVSLRLGYLGPNVLGVGSAVTAAVMLHLPALQLEQGTPVIPIGDDLRLKAAGPEGAAMYVLEIANRNRGDHEGLIQALGEQAEALVDYERDARQRVIAERRGELEDATYRALGTLRHARRLSIVEAYNALGLLRFGMIGGLLPGDGLDRVTELLFSVHESQVQILVAETDIDQARAKLVREALHVVKGVEGDV